MWGVLENFGFNGVWGYLLNLGVIASSPSTWRVNTDLPTVGFSTCILISSLVAFPGGGQCPNLNEISRKCHQALVFFQGSRLGQADFMR